MKYLLNEYTEQWTVQRRNPVTLLWELKCVRYSDVTAKQELRERLKAEPGVRIRVVHSLVHIEVCEPTRLR